MNWVNNILLFCEVCGLLSSRVRLNTHLYETELIAAVLLYGVVIQGRKKKGIKYLEYIVNYTE